MGAAVLEVLVGTGKGVRTGTMLVAEGGGVVREVFREGVRDDNIGRIPAREHNSGEVWRIELGKRTKPELLIWDSNVELTRFNRLSRPSLRRVDVRLLNAARWVSCSFLIFFVSFSSDDMPSAAE